MNLNQKAALMIRSLMRELRVSDHIVFHGDGNIISDTLLEALEGPHVADGTPDAALAIGEHAFRAGWRACAKWFRAPPGRITRDETALEHAWDSYDPPEDIKELS